MIVIAVESNPLYTVDFSCLVQPSLRHARDQLERTRGAAAADKALGSPLGRLLRNALYADGATRGLGTEISFGQPGDGRAHAIRSLTWQVVEPTPAGDE